MKHNIIRRISALTVALTLTLGVTDALVAVCTEYSGDAGTVTICQGCSEYNCCRQIWLGDHQLGSECWSTGVPHPPPSGDDPEGPVPRRA